MAYVAVRRMTVSGTIYEPGERVPLSALPARSLSPLLGRRMLHEVDDDALPKVQAAKRTTKAEA